MVTARPPGCTPIGESTSRLRHCCVPERVFGDRLIVARPRDGAPVVLASTAAMVWELLADWIAPHEIDSHLARAFPEVSAEDRLKARTEILATLQDDDLLERS